MGLPLIAINRLVTPTGTPDMVLAGGGITNVATSMTLNASPGVPANVPAAGTVRALIYNTGDTNPEFIDIDLSSRSTLTFTIARETEESTTRPKCAHSAGAGIWFVGTAAMWSGGGGGGGALVLLEQHTASGSASLDFTSFVDPKYDDYVIEIVNVVPATTGAELIALASHDGGATFDSTSGHYQWAAVQEWVNGALSVNSGGTGTSWLLTAQIKNDAAAGGATGQMRLYSPANAAAFRQVTSHTSYWQSTTDSYATLIGGGAWINTVDALNALRFVMTSGNIASGTIRVYGVAKNPGSSGSGGGLQLIEEHIAASSSALTFASISDLFDEYVLEGQSLTPSTGTPELLLQYSTDNGSTWITTGYYGGNASLFYDAAGAWTGQTWNNLKTGYTLVGSNPGLNAGTGAAASFTIRLNNLRDSTAYKVIRGDFASMASNGVWGGGPTWGVLKSAPVVTNIRLIPSSGLLATGTVRLYGVSKTPGAGTGEGPVLLEQHDAASSADLRFTSFVNDSLYSEYLVTLDHVVPATNNVNFLLRCSTDGGATYDSGSNYSTVGAYGYTGGVGVDGVSSDSATAIALLSSISNDAHWGLSGDARLRGLSNTAVYSVLNGQTMIFHATLSKILEAAITGAYKVTTAVNALQFLFSSGNIVSGTIRIYGVPRR